MRLALLVVFITLIGCSTKVSPKNIDWINGYWIIVKAEAPNGETRHFKGTVEVDFFEYNGSKGFRKKLKPILGNQFNSTNDAVGFTIAFKKKLCVITYSRQNHSWQEEVVSVNDEELLLKDGRGVLLYYKRYLP